MAAALTSGITPIWPLIVGQYHLMIYKGLRPVSYTPDDELPIVLDGILVGSVRVGELLP